MTGKIRLAVVVSHPIQYYAPLYRALAREPALDLRVLFASRVSLAKTYDPLMNVDVGWASDLTGGYPHAFLDEADSITRTDFRSVDNPSVTRALAKFRPEAVLLHGYAQKTLLRALFWCATHRARAILVSDSSFHVSAPGWRRSLKLALAPPLLRRFGAALTMGERSEAHLASLGYPGNRMFRTPMMIDEGFWRARNADAAARAVKRATLGLGDDDFVALSVGKLYAGKRVTDILDALARLKPGGRLTTVLIAGDGADRARLEAQAARSGVAARFLGFQNIDALPDLYLAADALVHAAEIEQFGMVALEAAVVGLPMVLSDRVGAIGTTSIARPGVNALVYPCADVAALAEALTTLRDDLDRRRTMAAASLNISADHAGPKSVAAVLAATKR